MLEYIQKYCQKYIEDHEITKQNKHTIKNFNDVTETNTALGNIMIDISKGIIAEDIVKYIAPYFQINNKQENFDFVDISDDEDI